MRTVSDRIQRKLGLKVNMTKTHITRPTKLKYLGSMKTAMAEIDEHLRTRLRSKEILARAGLVSCLDYYNERHALKLC